MDENGRDQDHGGLDAPKTFKDAKDCLKWCNKQKLATGCEYITSSGNCKAHTWSVVAGSGDKGTLCSVILPQGLFFTLLVKGALTNDNLKDIIKIDQFIAILPHASIFYSQNFSSCSGS